MNMKKPLILSALLLCAGASQAARPYTLSSPDGRLSVTVDAGERLTYSVSQEGTELLSPSQIALKLTDGRTFGADCRVRNARTRKVDATIEAPFYKRKTITDRYNELTISFRGNYAVVFRAYDEGVAYRFVTECPTDFTVENEIARFEFPGDCKAYVPYVKPTDHRSGDQYFNSFENTYTYAPLREMNPERLAFTPVAVEVAGRKVCIAEADVEHYPGMYVHNPAQENILVGNFAPYPDQIEQGGHNRLQGVVRTRKPFIAQCAGRTSFPWRAVIVAEQDCQLADNDMVYKLAAPSRVEDVSWIRPGKVAWEWWNHWGLKDVDFKTGVNNATYKAYIDFASEHGIEYVILDEGWAVNLRADLFQVVPEIDLKELTAYAASKNVGLILWAGYYAFARDIEGVCKHYAEMGIKGFKVDFMDRDDQAMVDFHYAAAEAAARHGLLLDFHGSYKPTGLQRTYPNVINFEGVHGLENMKWGDIKIDQMTYDVTMPYLRMLAGPVDYTQGAMRNGSKHTYRPVNREPMSQGTRAHQLAAYVVFESPLSMLCDSPSAYRREPECTAFIAEVPTVWDETEALCGRMGEYIAMARRKGDTWYVGAMTNWDARTLELDLSMLGEGDFTAEIYRDGANADNLASDYRKERIDIPADRRVKIELAPGGGYAMKIDKKR